MRMLPGTEVLHDAGRDPWWAGAVPDLARVAPPSTGTPTRGASPPRSSTCPSTCAGCVAGSSSSAGRDPDEPRRAAADRRRRGQLRRARLASLAGDLDVRPVRGQVVVVEGVDLDRWWLDCDRSDVRRPARATPSWSAAPTRTATGAGRPSPETAASILQRATRLVPGSPERGWSPTGSVCARCVPSSDSRRRVECVHCYGHGGAGVTVSWGCADEVTRLVERLGRRSRPRARQSPHAG